MPIQAFVKVDEDCRTITGLPRTAFGYSPSSCSLAEGLGLEAWLGLLAAENSTSPQGTVSILDEMNALRARVKPDPDDWTMRDYVQHGRQ